MNLVDSSGWLEFFADGPNADFFEEPIGATQDLIVPTVVVYEVFKKVLLERGESEALHAVGFLRLGTITDLTSALALAAAKLSAELSLPMADSIILATAQESGARVWTQDADFKDLDGVQFVAKRT